MKVKELIKFLKSVDQNLNVVLQCDSEGNGYSPAAGAEFAIYDENNGAVYSLKYSAEDCCLEDDEWEKMKKSKKAQCVVIWPD